MTRLENSINRPLHARRVTMSPGSSDSSSSINFGRWPTELRFSCRIVSTPDRRSASSCSVVSCSVVETRAYPYIKPTSLHLATLLIARLLNGKPVPDLKPVKNDRKTFDLQIKTRLRPVRIWFESHRFRQISPPSAIAVGGFFTFEECIASRKAVRKACCNLALNPPKTASADRSGSQSLARLA